VRTAARLRVAEPEPSHDGVALGRNR
jgi:hypothetical protein